MSDIADQTVEAVIAEIAGKKPKPPPANYMDPGYGPQYPALGSSVAKYRRMAIKGLASLLVRDRHHYGEFVLEGFRTRQRQELQRELPSHNVYCASGTNHNTGEAIIAAVQRRARAALAAAPSQERRARTDLEWEEMYAKAMKEKAERPVRELWTAKGVPAKRQNKMVAEIEAKAAPGAMVGPFKIGRVAKGKVADTPPPPPSGAGYVVTPMKQKDRFIVKVDPLPDGSKAMPAIVIGNQIKCRFSHRDGGYLATSAQIERFQRIISTLA